MDILLLYSTSCSIKELNMLLCACVGSTQLRRFTPSYQPLGRRSDDDVQGSTPLGHGSNPRAFGHDTIPVNFTTAAVDIDLGKLQPASLFPEVAADPEENDDKKGKIRLEEALGIVEASPERPDGSVKLKRRC